MKKRSLVPVVLMAAIFGLIFFSFQPVQAQKAPQVTLKFANFFPPPSGQSKTAEEFCKELQTLSNGRIKVDYFAGGTLLKAPTMIKGVETGIADIGLAHIEYTPGRFPVTEVAELPLGYPTGWVGCQVMNDFVNTYMPKEWDKVHIMWMHGNGPSVVITKKPVRKMEDFKGMTIRAPGLMADVISALGGTPAPTPMMETYDAIAKGVIDGSFTAGESVKTFRFGEVVKYVTNSWMVGPVYPFYVVINKNSYKKLPPDLKELFDRLCGVYRERFALLWNGLDFDGKDFGLSKGVEYIDLPKEEAAKWTRAMQPVLDGYVKKMVGAGHKEEEIRGWIKFLNERTEYYTAKQLAYRIRSVTGPPEVMK